MGKFTPMDDQYESKIRTSFSNQGFMHSIGAELLRIEPGEVRIGLIFSKSLTQQHGFIHAGVITAIIDTACGYAAYTLMSPDSEVLTIEYKVNFLSPARGEKFIATGNVIKQGKTIMFCQGEMVAVNKDGEKTIATMSATMISIEKDRNA
jgi:uncharacterized protein (TIGR00369 family)